MTLDYVQKRTLIKDLGEGLVLRRATLEDTERLVAFNARVHGDNELDAERVLAWTRDLMENTHPTFAVSDFTVVEDTTTAKIVSTMNLISQTWMYGGISFPVGRPELVSTDPEYRNRGLVRAQFEEVHRWSAERGEMVQAITGIPYYYRLFGYEMGLALGGGRVGYKVHVPRLKDGEQESYHVRPATETDLGVIADIYRAACRRYLVSCVWDEALWRYELVGKRTNNVNRMELRLIETLEGEPVGFLAHPIMSWGPTMVATVYEIMPGLSWASVTPSVVRYLYATGEAYAAVEGKKDEFGAFGFWLGNEHPVYQVLSNSLPRVRKPYAWYVRVPDLPGFIRHIAPFLEQRLSASPYAAYSGELKITFYRSGLRIVFDKGRMSLVEAWKPMPQGHSGDAAFPDLTFLQLLFGYRSLEEIQYAFADCWTETELEFGLINALFPKQSSDIWPIS